MSAHLFLEFFTDKTAWLWFLKTDFKGTPFMHPQIERLRQDSRELKYYLYRLKKNGRSSTAHRIQAKLDYLDAEIEDIQASFAT